MASAQQQQQQQHGAETALQVELSVMPPSAHQQQQQQLASWFPSPQLPPPAGDIHQQQQQQQQQQVPGMVQPELSVLPPHQLLLQQQCTAIAAEDAPANLEPSAIAAQTAVPMLSVVASTSAAAAAAGGMAPSVSINPFVVAAAADFEQSFLHSLSVAAPLAATAGVTAASTAAATASNTVAAHLAAAAAAAGPSSAVPVKRDRAAFKQQQQHNEAELIQLMSSSLSLSLDAPSAKQLKQALSSSNKADNSVGVGDNTFSFSLQLPSGLSGMSLPGVSGLSSPRFTVSSSSFPFNSSAATPAGSAAAAAAAIGGGDTHMTEDAGTDAAAAGAAGTAPARTILSSPADTAADAASPAVQQATTLYSNLQVLLKLLVLGGPSLFFQLFDCSSINSSCNAGTGQGSNLGRSGSQIAGEQQLQHSAWSSMQAALLGLEPEAAAAAGSGQCFARNSSGSNPFASNTTACFAANPQQQQQQQQQQVLSGISLSGDQRQALQQLLHDAAASHAADRQQLLQQLGALTLRVTSGRSSITSAAMCSSGIASWEAVQCLVEALHASCDSDTAVLQRVLQQCWGPQVRAAEAVGVCNTLEFRSRWSSCMAGP
jgi:hypothetical protein